MKYCLLIVFLLLLSCTPYRQTVVLPEDAGSRSSKFERFEPMLEATIQNFPENTEIAVAIIDDDEVEYRGYRRTVDSFAISRNETSIFGIGSVTKVFTATLLANAVTEGKVGLDDPINPYYDFTFNGGHEVTFGALASHTSGLPRLPANMNMSDIGNPYALYDGAHLEAYLKTYLKPGTKTYTYSNLGAGLLAYTLEKVYGKPLESLLKSFIFDKYDMEGSATDPDLLPAKRLIQGLNYEGKPAVRWRFDALAGAGAMVSSCQNLVGFLYAQFNEEETALALTRQARTKVNEQLQIGLGWHIISNEGQRDWYWHNGATGGFVSSVVFEPNSSRGIIVLSNVSAYNPQMGKIDELTFKLMKELSE